ncbi:hypothetical protein ATSB10_31730 [Dyella thiooxydans]|uniref:Uracil-DNA glycosylase-like domain-containing protein n=1 Tax=Dyella thiooxydans TaxID=445710 RepID=A0A160N468_9GAMM|nr:hypothetical protein [Dyella thiooxydans]AND70627.1 hypothetical protein ATSB10_31730 [Dyella thiooxydans]
MSEMLNRFRSTVLNLQSASVLDQRLLISQSGDLATYYSPFEHLNEQARVVLVGITPGKFQAQAALDQLRACLREGFSDADALRRAKETASFSGSMRTALVEMLDRIGLHVALGLRSSADLFGTARSLVHYTSVLRHPVFAKGENYAGNPAILRTPYLKGMTDQWLADEVRKLPNALWIPLGKEPTAVMRSFAERGLIEGDRVLDGLPHPSGANAERIAYFLGRKQRGQLSSKTRAESIDSARDVLIRKVSGVRG